MRNRPAVSGLILLTTLLAVLPSIIPAQVTRTKIDTKVERTFTLKLGQTGPIRDYLDAQATSNDKLRLLKENKPSYVRNFVGRERKKMKEGALPIGADPLLNQQTTRAGGILIEPEIVIEGIDQGLAGANPPDCNGDVSDLYYIEVTNATWIQVYDPLGNPVADAFRANAIWQQVGQTSFGDVILIFDQEADRWFLTEFPTSNRVLIAISDSNDPLGTWTAYAFQTPNFPDYPKYGIWDNAYVLTSNEGGGGLACYLFNRSDLLNSEDTVDMQRFTTPRPVGGWFVSTPVNWIGHLPPAAGTKPMVMNVNDDGWGATEDVLEIYEINVDWDDESNSVIEQTVLPTTPFDTDLCSESGAGFACIPQPNGQGIDGIPDIILNKIEYRNFGGHSSIVLNFGVDVTGEQDSGIRWMELRKTGDDPWEIYQEGTVGTKDGENRFMGGISIDSKGNIGLAYNISSETTFPSLRYTGRFASDPLGEMSLDEYEFGTGSGSMNGGRFGDYASMSVDPQDIFWYTGVYVTSNNFWGTKNVAYRLERFASDIGPLAVVEPEDSPDLDSENLSVSIRNYGIMPQTDFQIGYSFDGGPTIVEDVSIDTLFTDSVYVHTFQNQIQFDEFGPYPLLVFTAMLSDSNTFNDTSEFVIRKQSIHDAEVYAVDGITQVVCDTFLDVDVYIRNSGQAILTSVDIIISVNSEDQAAIPWTGNLETGEITSVDATFTKLIDGINDVVVRTSNPNGVDDQDETNDRIDLEVNVTSGGTGVSLNLLTDLFPEETSWELQDLNGNILFEDGPLSKQETVHTNVWCLELDSCYLFILFDSYGDGLTAQGVDGDFIIVNSDGGVLASLGEPNFGSELITEFCVSVGCSLGAIVNVAHETIPGASNGLINIFAAGGSAPYQFSIDGGLTFQSSPIFAGLSPGIYQILVVDQGGCEAVSEKEVLACAMQVMFEVSNASGSDKSDGSINVLTEGGSGAVEYSMNGGSFQENPLFENLSPGMYGIEVKDSVRCTVADSVEVSFTSSIEYTTQGQIIRVFPNPSQGDFYIEIEGLSDVYLLKFQVIDENGRVILTQDAGNFSGILKGYFTINTVPSGMYFLRFEHPDLDRLVRVIKQ
jgi:hypothetical protein